MPSLDVVDRFVRIANAHPDRDAVRFAKRVTSYGALLERVRRFASTFAAVESPKILIALPQDVDAYAAIFAAGMAGGFHVPVNLGAPPAKLARVASQVRPDLIVATGDLAKALAEVAPGARVVHPDEAAAAPPFDDPGRRHSIAYVLFTSGSTGQPKGVVVPRSALAHYVDWMERTFDVRPHDRFSQHPNLAFDISMTDIFGALCHGAALCPLAAGDRMLPARYIRRERITVWNSVPSVVSLMMQAEEVTAENLASVRLFNFCGEPLLPTHLEALFEARPDVLVQNTYGPTEATIAMTALPLTTESWRAHAAASVAIGDPIAGMDVVLAGGPTPDEGEIVIVGPQLAQGYWNDADKTAAAFRTVETSAGPQRGYHTGDWAERRGGDVFFKERMDFQVKVRGYRIELDEVASAIRDCGWPVAVVFKHEDALGALVEATPGQIFDESGLRRALAGRLEEHAVPMAVRMTPAMPRNDNDKIDRHAAIAWFLANL